MSQIYPRKFSCSNREFRIVNICCRSRSLTGLCLWVFTMTLFCIPPRNAVYFSRQTCIKNVFLIFVIMSQLHKWFESQIFETSVVSCFQGEKSEFWTLKWQKTESFIFIENGKVGWQNVGAGGRRLKCLGPNRMKTLKNK